MNIPDTKVIVIGAGIGGLSAALRLAHAGLDVTVLERHAKPGGKMRTVPSDAGPVDAGPTVMTMRHVFDDLFADVGETLSDHVTLDQENILARHWWQDGSSLDLHSDPDLSAKAIREFAGPKAEMQFRAFSTRMAHLFDAFDAPMMQAAQPDLTKVTARVLREPSLIPKMAPLSTLARALRRQFTDPRLAQLFGRYATYVGGSPYQSPALLGLIAHAEAKGVWRIMGGMHLLAAAIERLAKAKGAKFIYDCDVDRIEVQQGKIRAVHAKDGQHYLTNRVIFNGDPRALRQGLLGNTTITAVDETATEPRSLSAYVWAFSANYEGPKLAHHNVFFGVTPQAEFDALQQGKMPTDPTLYVCDQGNGRFEIIMNGPPQETHKQEFEQCQILVFKTLARFGLTFDPLPGPSSLTTPADFNQLFPASAGSLYGRSPHGMMAAFARPTTRTKLPGLYLTGGGTHPGAGIPMATLSARHAAEAILTDLALTSTSRQTVTPGGTLTGSATAVKKPSRSSVL
ncbi:1-hydroxycarotenoid 3,4-desaturase CrtD [Parasulfitobacter algicola]|uniref:FAD-dependent oxidoreductase n=1 Tax=Parasulfitobacter algicola TaxID=2614809 RepID=A0ABX2IMM7_9RHOB|nr:1-hydroxycarotenoid 3,4-desaturase CrtD [Sulfitobacter algicola]NSX53231.1 FAD-dependent oxidoreductase [Sulfitobacter algicola]